LKLQYPKKDTSCNGTITIRFTSQDALKGTGTAIASAINTLQPSGVESAAAATESHTIKYVDGVVNTLSSPPDAVKGLAVVMSKLKVFMEIVDETVKVRAIYDLSSSFLNPHLWVLHRFIHTSIWHGKLHLRYTRLALIHDSATTHHS